MSAEGDEQKVEEEAPHQQFAKFIFGLNWMDAFSPRTASQSRKGSAKSQNSKRLYFGAPSLVPSEYQPPPHPIIWDGTVAPGRKVNVRNFHRHFACFQATDLNEKIVSNLERLGEYRKPIWYSAVLVSAAPVMFEHELVFKREEIEDHDGGIITVDWAFPEQRANEEPLPATEEQIPTVLLFPGLSGHSGKDYIRSMTARLTRFMHARVCVLNWRGFNCKLTTTKVFQPGDISDMQAVILNAKKSYPNSKIFAVGYSAGSNQLVKYLGSHKTEHPLAAAVSVCNGFEYEAHIRRLEGSAFGEAIYSRGMTFLHQATTFHSHD